MGCWKNDLPNFIMIFFIVNLSHKKREKTTGGNLRLNNVKNFILLFPHLYNHFPRFSPIAVRYRLHASFMHAISGFWVSAK